VWPGRKERPAGEVTLPDGRRVTLDRPWHEYSTEDLAALGITPGMGGEDIIAVVGDRDRP
jgi:hypothetical protein